MAEIHGHGSRDGGSNGFYLVAELLRQFLTSQLPETGRCHHRPAEQPLLPVSTGVAGHSPSLRFGILQDPLEVSKCRSQGRPVTRWLWLGVHFLVLTPTLQASGGTFDNEPNTSPLRDPLPALERAPSVPPAIDDLVKTTATNPKGADGSC